MGNIPITPGQLPTKLEPMDDGATYRGVIREMVKADDPDKNGRRFFKINSIEVLEPLQWKGRSTSDNYICIPFSDTDKPSFHEMNEFEKAREMEKGVRLAQLCQSSKVDGVTIDELTPDIFVGKEISFTIKNEEYTEESENYISKVDRYLF